LSRSWRPVAAGRLPLLLADQLAALPGLVRVAVDGAPWADPDGFAAALRDPLQALGRPAAHVPTRLFLRDAALRLEHGRTDVLSYPEWTDFAALRREVLDARGSYLPSLRDPATNRATRTAREPLAPDAFLLGRGLPFERTVHLALSPAARARRAAADEAWTLPAFADYDPTAHTADVVIKLDDPRHPAVDGL
jgi:hypothetical protein